MGFVIFSNTRTLFSPNCINPLVFAMQNVSVYCGVGDDLLHIIYCKGTEGTQDTDNRTSHAERATLFVSVGVS